LGGPVVVTFLIVLVSAVVAETWRWRRGGRGMPWRAWAGGGAVLAAALVFGAVRFAQVDAERSAAPVVRVGVVQAGVMQSGWTGRPADADLAARYRRVSERLEAVAGRLDLLVWPEKATNGVFRRDPRRDAPLGRARRIRGRFTSPLLFGATAVDPDTREAYNSALLLEHDGRLSVVYDKIRLIFYSEHLPGWLDRIGDSASRYRAGTRRDPIRLSVGGESVAVGVFICFEAAFPAHVRALAAHGAELWVNLSDDSWFADTSEPEQHLAAAVFRAIESRRDVVRAAGSGVSAWITAGGEIALRTALNASPDDAEVGVVVAPRRLRAPGLHAAAGDLFAVWCLAAIVTGVVVIGVRRRRRRRIPPTSSGLAPGGDSDTLVP
jgi:apolipoprotein N-acyltransferase